jgi:hypothetical protein
VLEQLQDRLHRRKSTRLRQTYLACQLRSVLRNSEPRSPRSLPGPELDSWEDVLVRPGVPNRFVALALGANRRPGNLIGKPQCVNGLRASRNMLKPAFWSPAEPAWDFEVTPFPFQKAILGAAGDRCPLGDHLKTDQRTRAGNVRLSCRTGTSSGRFCSVSF